MNRLRVFLVLILTPWIAMADGRVLHIGNTAINLVQSCNSEHSLNLKIGNETWCAELTTELADNTVHVRFDNVTYTVCDGTCGGGSGGGEYVMPEVPPEPEQLPSDCAWTQTNENAYLLSDGNQYFDTTVTVDTNLNIEVTTEIVNGASARVFGTFGASTSCYYDFAFNAVGKGYFRMGNQTGGASLNSRYTYPVGKHTYKTVKSGYNKNLLVDGAQAGQKVLRSTYYCTASNTIMVFNGDYLPTIDQTQSGGIKVYNIKLYNSSGTMIHNYQPVAAGTDICGYTVPTNAMWDTVSKQVYLPAGTGQMGYGIDP